MQHPFELSKATLSILDLQFEAPVTEESPAGGFKKLGGMEPVKLPIFTMVARPDGTIECIAEDGGSGGWS